MARCSNDRQHKRSRAEVEQLTGATEVGGVWTS